MQTVLSRIEAAREYLFFINDVNSGVIVLNYNGTITDTNKKFCTMTDYLKTEIIGRKISDLFPETKKRLFFEKVTGKNSDKRRRYELSLITKKGLEINTLVQIIPAYMQDIDKKKIITLIVNISDSAQIKKEIEKKEKKLKMYTEILQLIKSQAGFVLKDIEPKIKKNETDFLYNTLESKFVLTRSELKVAKFVNIGLTTKEIAAKLCLSERTVSNHRQNIRRKLGLVKIRNKLKAEAPVDFE